MRPSTSLVLSGLLLAALIPTAAPAFASDSGSGWTTQPLLDVRVRQEILENVYHFTPADPDRDWIRIRSRLGAAVEGHGHRFELRLTNEHRHYLHPDDVDFDWDELIIDRAAWNWRPGCAGDAQLTVGRQDIVWPGGFLMLEGHPLDGSRSIYHNAVRLQFARGADRFDLAAIYDPLTDDLVLAGDEDRRLTNGDELGLAARWLAGRWQWACILKREDRGDLDLPRFDTMTLGARWTGPICRLGDVEAEAALQYQHLGDSSALPAAAGWEPDASAWAHAAQLFVARPTAGGVTVKAGGFLYSGSEGGLGAFRAPWGNWPKWSDLYIYTLIAEAGDGRVHVAAWENIAAPRVELTRPLGRMLGRTVGGRLAASWLLAPEPEWKSRGLLTQCGLQADLGGGWDAHLLWEFLDPGSFHDGANGLPVLDEPAHFLRWQITYALK